MKKFVITEEEKKSILGKYFSKEILNEQPFLKKLFGSNADDLFRVFSDDVVKSLDDVFAKVLTRPANYATEAGQILIKSASGAKIPMKTIKDAVELVAQGKLEPSRVAQLLPRNLADGSEFRNIITSALETRGVKKAIQNSVSKLPLGKIGQDFKEMAKDMNWIQATNSKGNMSGWKFHVYADNLDEVAFLYEKLLPVVNKHGAAFKLAGSNTLERLANNTVQRGKGVTLYIPSNTISNNAQKEFLSDIQSAIKGYEKTGTISGDNMITNNIGYRYELSQPIDASKGVNMNQYRALYKSNEGGAHNIAGNADIF